MRQAYPLSLGHETEQRSVPVEAPRATLLDDLEAGLDVPIEQLVGDPAGGGLVGKLDRVVAEPLRLDDCHDGVRDQSTDDRSRRERFQFRDVEPPSGRG